MKKYIFPILAMFVVLAISYYVINMIMLRPLYMHTASVWRPEELFYQKNWLFYPAHLFFSIIFVILYSKIYQSGKNGLMQGLQFGFWIGLLVGIAPSVYAYVGLFIHVPLALSWMAGDLIQYTICGAVVGFLYR